MKANERGFEDAIEASLLADGYLKSVPSHFDPVLGLDTAELYAFIGATQIDQWESLLARYGNDPDAAQRGFAAGWLPSWTTGARSTYCATGSWTLGSRPGWPSSSRRTASPRSSAACTRRTG